MTGEGSRRDPVVDAWGGASSLQGAQEGTLVKEVQDLWENHLKLVTSKLGDRGI